MKYAPRQNQWDKQLIHFQKYHDEFTLKNHLQNLLRLAKKIFLILIL